MDKQTLVKCSNRSSKDPFKVHFTSCEVYQDASTQVRTRHPKVDKCNSQTPEQVETLLRELQNHYVLLARIFSEMHLLQAENRANNSQLVDMVNETIIKIQKLDLQEKRSTSKLRNFDQSPESILKEFTVRMDSNVEQAYANRSTNSTNPDAKVSVMDALSQYAFKRNLSSQAGHMPCPEVCPSCGTTIKLLLSEIGELRNTRTLLLRIRDEANNILDEVIAQALEQTRIISVPNNTPT